MQGKMRKNNLEETEKTNIKEQWYFSVPFLVVVYLLSLCFCGVPAILLTIIRFIKVKEKKTSSIVLLVLFLIAPLVIIIVGVGVDMHKEHKIERLIEQANYVEAQQILDEEIEKGTAAYTEYELYSKLYEAQDEYDLAIQMWFQYFEKYGVDSESAIEYLKQIKENASKDNQVRADEVLKEYEKLQIEKQNEMQNTEEQETEEKEQEEIEKTEENNNNQTTEFQLEGEYLIAKEFLNSEMKIDTSDMENEKYQEALLYLYMEAKILREDDAYGESDIEIEDMKKYLDECNIQYDDNAKSYYLLNEYFHFYLRHDFLEMKSEEWWGTTDKLEICESTFYELIGEEYYYGVQDDSNIQESEKGVFVADTYAEFDMQVPIEQVIEENNRPYYNNLTLLTHDVQTVTNEDSTVSVTDSIQMYAEMGDEHGYVKKSKTFRRLYWYWDNGMGWLPNIEFIEEWSADVTGFSNTYWKLPEGGESHYMYGYLFDTGEVDLIDKDIEVYLHFGNIYIPEIEYRSHGDEWDVFAAMSDGEIVLKYDDVFLKMPLAFSDVMEYSSDPSITMWETGEIFFNLYAPTTGGSINVSYKQDYEDGSYKEYYPSYGYYLQSVTEEEYLNFINSNE